MKTSSDPFRIRDHVADFETFQHWYVSASQDQRASGRTELNVAYGAGEGETLDLYFPEAPAPNAPIHMFVHGGYWRANRKEDYAFVAAPILAQGGIAAIIDYSLMPKARMAHLVDQVRRAAVWVRDNAERLGADGQRFSASGHSAGAHLVSYLAARGPHETELPQITAQRLLLVSGIYDLVPIATSFLQAEIGLTETEIRHFSPISAVHNPDVSMTIAVGSDETVPFHTQADALVAHLARRGAACEKHVMSGLNHMSIIAEMGTPDSAMSALLIKQLS